MQLRELEQKTRAWMERYADGPRALWLLGIISFFESSVLPLPPSAFMLGMIALGKRHQWVFLATLTTLTSVAGGLFGYVIGSSLYDTLGVWIIEQYDLAEDIAYLGTLFADNAFLANFVGAFTPIPYKAFTIASGFFSIPVVVFTIASVIGRGLRFFVVAYLAHVYGVQIARGIFKYIVLITLAAIVILLLLGAAASF